jgi:hypothetical protein
LTFKNCAIESVTIYDTDRAFGIFFSLKD